MAEQAGSPCRSFWNMAMYVPISSRLPGEADVQVHALCGDQRPEPREAEDTHPLQGPSP
jgi:hypothetical protein